MEASGSGLFNNFIGIPSVDPSLYPNQTYPMDWSRVSCTSASFQAEQGAVEDFGAEGLQQVYTGMQQGYIGMQQVHIGLPEGHFETPGGYIELQQVYSEIQQGHIGMQQGHIGMQQGYIGLQQGYIGLQQEHIGVQQEHIGVQQEHIGVQQEHIGVQQEHIGVQQEHIGVQQEHIGVQQEHIGVQQEHIEMQQGYIGVQQGHIGVQQRHIGMQQGHIGMQQGHIGMQQGHIGMQQWHIGMQQGHIGMQQGHIGMQQGHIGMQQGHIGMRQGHIGMQQGHIETQGTFGTQVDDIRTQDPQEGDVRPQKGDVRPQEGEECDVRPQEGDCGTQEEETPIFFYDKVSVLMHAFGDALLPLNQSSWLIHNIMQSQMVLLIRYCEDVMKIRGAKQISYEDVLFLMRRNKVLLKRLLQYLYVQDCNEYLLPGFAEYRGTTVIPAEGEKVHRCLEFLSTIEKCTGDLTYLFSSKNVYDRILQKRLKRRYSILNSEDTKLQKYFESNLKVSFCLPSPDLFKNWLLQCSGTLFDIDPLAVSIIDFLIIETIAGLVEKALYMRSRKWKEKKDLLLHFDCPIQIDYSDDDISEDDFGTSEIDKYSYIPRKYLKKRNCSVNNEKRISDDGTFYQDSMLAVLPKIVLLPNYLPRDFIQRNENPPLNLLVKTDSEMELIPKNPITSQEIRNAFIHYQRPKPMTVLLKSKLPYSEKRKTRLVCLAFPEEEFEEDA